MTSERGEFNSLRAQWRGDVGPVLRPEVHHQDLEVMRPPGRYWKNKREGEPGGEEDK